MTTPIVAARTKEEVTLSPDQVVSGIELSSALIRETVRQGGFFVAGEGEPDVEEVVVTMRVTPDTECTFEVVTLPEPEGGNHVIDWVADVG